MRNEEVRKLSFGKLMAHLADAQPGSIMRPIYEAEYERRKHVWTIVGIVVVAVGIVVGAAVTLIVHFY